MESHVRRIIKAFSWRLLATVITFTVSWILTGRVTLAAEIGVADTLLKLGVYYSHERIVEKGNKDCFAALAMT